MTTGAGAVEKQAAEAVAASAACFSIPLRVSGPNLREHPLARCRRVKQERGMVAWAFVRLRLEGKTLPKLPVVVTLARVGKQLLDDDNLQGSMKAVRDQVARELGCGDSPSDPIIWAYGQRKSDRYAVEVEVRPA